MLTYPTITTAPPEATSRNYGDLREEAIAELQALSGAIWTDYNLHDPGVTLLEVLIYAITDLGYKVDNDVATLLASHPEGAIDLGEHFHRAKYILPNCPYTPTDYRRYFLDIPGVQNVFLQRAPNLCPFIYCRTEVWEQATGLCDATYPSLAFNRDQAITNWAIADWERLHLNGLYCASLILESDVVPLGATLLRPLI